MFIHTWPIVAFMFFAAKVLAIGDHQMVQIIYTVDPTPEATRDGYLGSCNDDTDQVQFQIAQGIENNIAGWTQGQWHCDSLEGQRLSLTATKSAEAEAEGEAMIESVRKHVAAHTNLRAPPSRQEPLNDQLPSPPPSLWKKPPLKNPNPRPKYSSILPGYFQAAPVKPKKEPSVLFGNPPKRPGPAKAVTTMSAGPAASPA